MIFSHFRIAIRNLIRNRSYTFINVIGIAIGMTAFFLFALYIADELSFDRFHTKKNSIVRVVQHETWDGGEAHLAVTSGALAPALKQEFPEVLEAVRVVPEGGGIIGYQNKTLKAQNIFFADRSFFYLFTFPLLYGDSKTALAQPESIVLSESLATHIFGDAKKALNEVVYFDGNFANKVTGVMKDIPDNSHLEFEAVRSLPHDYSARWSNADQYTYLLLSPGASHKGLEHKLSAFAAKNIKTEKNTGEVRLELQPLDAIHLYSDLDFDAGSNNNIKRIYLFALLGCLVLVIAVINYMNLSIARAFLRIREVGIRKVIGSRRRNLMSLFIADALVVSMSASLVSFILITALLPLFNSLADKHLELWSSGAWQPLVLLLAFALVIGVVSGSYPAWFLSRFKTTAALKGLLGDLTDSVLLRKSLVVFQFVVTIMMISASAVIFRQLRYVADKDLGFNKHEVLTFHIADRSLRERLASLKTELLRNPAVQAVAAAGNPIGNNDLGLRPWFFTTFNGSLSTNSTVTQTLVVDADFVPTMEIKTIAGRNFSAAVASDRKEGVLINETLQDALGFENAIGKSAAFRKDDGVLHELKIIGVVKDFHTYSLQHKVLPMVLMMADNPIQEDNLYVRVDTKSTGEALHFLTNTYRKFDPANPIEISFLDQNFGRQYVLEQKQGQLSLVFTILAVMIACLGLFGLAAFTAQQRVKEIGIRKVLGASVRNIVSLLSREYATLIVIAALIAIPTAYWSMGRWLEQFAYRIDANIWIFIGAGATALLIALLTVAVQAFNAAIADPVKSLRSE